MVMKALLCAIKDPHRAVSRQLTPWEDGRSLSIARAPVGISGAAGGGEAKVHLSSKI